MGGGGVSVIADVRSNGVKGYWLFLFPVFLFAAQLKEFFLYGLKKLEQ
jgi:hypothetical protein